MKGQRKFKVVPREQRTYNGAVYDSRLESRYAEHLDHLLLIGEIRSWRRGERIPLVVGLFVIGYYKPDFIVADLAGEWLVEVKNFWTSRDRQRVRLFGACRPGAVLRCVMWRKGQWVITPTPRPRPLAAPKRSRRKAAAGTLLADPFVEPL